MMGYPPGRLPAWVSVLRCPSRSGASLFLLLLASLLADIGSSSPGPARPDARPSRRGLIVRHLERGGPGRIEPLGAGTVVAHLARAGGTEEEARLDLQEEVRVIVALRGRPALEAVSPLAPTRGIARVQALAQEHAAFQDEVLRIGRAVWPQSEESPGGLPGGLRLEGAAPVRFLRDYARVFNGFALAAPRWLIEEVRALPSVAGVWEDAVVEATLEESVPLIRAPEVWEELGARGEGVVVGIIDTGVDYTHPALGGGLGPGRKVIGGWDFVNDDPDPMDDHSHGTHVAGIVAANSASLRGVAPEAQLMAFKVLNAWGSGYMSDVIAGIERAVDPDQDGEAEDAVDIINMSLGGGGDPDDPASRAVDVATSAGVLACVAAGNSGGYRTIGSPGTARAALTVGASDKSDHIAYFSSRGPSAVTWAIKPEVTAPGVAILSSVPGGGTRSYSGTSMATPHVAGAAALLRQLHPDWPPEALKAALVQTARDIGQGAFVQGGGRIDVRRAAEPGLAIEPAVLSWGLDDLAEGVWARSDTLTVRGVGEGTSRYTLRVAGDFPVGVEVSLAPTEVLLGLGDEEQVVVRLAVDNGAIPLPTTEPYAYEGTVVAASATDTLRVPCAFLVSPALEITSDADIWVLMIHDRAGRYWWYPWPARDLSVLLPAGLYDLIALFPDAATMVVREGIDVHRQRRIALRKAEAVNRWTLEARDHDGGRLSVQIGNSSFIHGPSGLGLILLGGFSTVRDFSDVSGAYRWGWMATALDEGELYVLQGALEGGIARDQVHRTDPASLRTAQVRYRGVPGRGGRMHLQNWVCYVEQYWAIAVASSGSDQEVEEPGAWTWHFEPDASLVPRHLLQVSLVDGDPYRDDDAVPLLETPYYRARDGGRIEGYLWGASRPVVSSEVEHLLLGAAPPRWAARLSSDASRAILDASHGHLNRFLLDPWGGFVPYSSLEYELRRGSELLARASLPSAGANGYGPPFETIPLPGAGTYTLTVPYARYRVGEAAGSARTVLRFRAGGPGDGDPPILEQFVVMAGAQPADSLGPGESGRIEVQAEDRGGAVDLVLEARREGGSWAPLTLQPSDSLWSAPLPDTLAGGAYALRLTATDAAGNLLEQTIEPAFLWGIGTGNSPPVLAPLADVTCAPGATVAWRVTATDSDGDEVLLSAERLPAGATFDSVRTGRFAWSPGVRDLGADTAIFVARDGKGGSDADTVIVTVTTPMTWEEQFEGGELSGWTLSGGAWSCVGGTLVGEEARRSGLAIAPVTMAAGAIGARLRVEVTGKEQKGALVFGYRGPRDYRFVEMRRRQGRWVVGEVRRGREVVRGAWRGRVGEGAWVEAFVEERGSVRVRIDGTERLVVRFGDVWEGRAGLRVAKGRIVADSLIVAGAGSGAPAGRGGAAMASRGPGSGEGPANGISLTGGADLPREYLLGAPYPSPGPAPVTIPVEIPAREAGWLTEVNLYTLRGHLVRSLAPGGLEGPGRYLLRWDGRTGGGERAPPGIYLCELRAPDHRVLRKVILRR